MKKISVIIPCYNVAEYIEKCILALSKQNFYDFEVIFIDDCSKDATVDIIEKLIKYYNINARVIKSSCNLGPSNARKIGIENSTSEYVTFCDSDDWYETNFLYKMFEATEKQKKDIVFCNYKLVYDSGRILKKNIIANFNLNDNEIKKILTIDVDSLCIGLYRRKLFSCIEFPNIKNGEDMAIIPLLISKASYFGFVNDYIYNYFQREGSLSTIQTENTIKNLVYSFEYIYKNIDLKKYNNETEYIGVRNVLYGVLINLMKYGNKKIEAQEIINLFEKRFPKWFSNIYIKNLPIYKKIYLFGVRLRLFIFLRILSKLHTKLTK